jgi:hypothetical protein
VNRSLLETIQHSNDDNLGAALIRMAHEAVAVHRYQTAAQVASRSDVADRWQGLSQGVDTDKATNDHSEDVIRLKNTDTTGGSQ